MRPLGTMTANLLGLVDWLVAVGGTHVAMESIGVHWKLMCNLLEATLEVLVVKARHIKNGPGRKAGVRDCEWIAEPVRHGVLRPSFIPEQPQRELRALTRHHTALLLEAATTVDRKVLEGANIKLASVAIDVLGKSGREILTARVAGTTDGAALAQLARGRLREKIPQLVHALTGQFEANHRFLCAEQLTHIDCLEAALEPL